jgi:hypothetical protein
VSQPATYTCGGPDRCMDDLCRGSDVGLCGQWSDRLLGLDTCVWCGGVDCECDTEEDDDWEPAS